MHDSNKQEGAKVCQAYGVDPSKGLSPDQVEKQRAEHGWNETPAPDPTPYWKLLLQQFEDLLVRILLAAAAISVGLAFLEGEMSFHAFVEPIVILTILVLNAVVGVWQESNAEAAIEALKQFVSQTAVVLRDGAIKTVPARDVVPGDIVQVSVGQQIPADIRLLHLDSTTLRVDQSLLTGESDLVMKFPEVAQTEDRYPLNLLFAGTSVGYGKALGVCVLTGLNTEYGKIESVMRNEEEVKTPLQKKLDEFGELLSKVIAVICILVWVVNIGHFTDPAHGSMMKGAVYYFKIAVALAVAAIPEGLPAVVTTCLALGTKRMAKKNALIRSLPSVETLGCTTVICSDKTGTLTTNMMSTAKVIFFSQSGLVECDVEDTKMNCDKVGTLSIGGKAVTQPLAKEPQLQDIARVSALCNDCTLEFDAKTQQVARVGEATEAALLVLAEKLGLADRAEHDALALEPKETRPLACKKFWERQYTKKATLEFTRARKSMSVYCTSSQGNSLFVKGAPENILERCTSIKVGNNVQKITAAQKSQLGEVLHRITTGETTLRCLGLAEVANAADASRLPMDDPAKFEDIEANMTFLGLVGMLDPPRKEVKDAIVRCHTAGVRVIVITGDNKDTAESICRRIGVFSETESVEGKSFTGAEFAKLTRDQQAVAVQNARLFSRTDPSFKMDIVKRLQETGDVCAMTGDGVNDAPALKKAEIGIAMGSGTEVAKAASKMVLSDDNFSSIVGAIEEGRAIYNNTKQFIRYLISSNIGEVVCIFLTALLGMPEVLVPVQLLWVNLVTDGLPATALGFNPADPDIMKKPPRKSSEPIVNGWLFARYMLVGIYVGVATVGGFIWWYCVFPDGPQISFADLTSFHSCVEGERSYSCSIFSDKTPMTVSLSVLVTVEMFNALNALSEDNSVLTVSPFSNIWLLLAIAGSFATHFAVLYTAPMRALFGVVALGWAEWKAVLWISAPVILLDEALKFVSRNLPASPKVKTE